MLDRILYLLDEAIYLKMEGRLHNCITVLQVLVVVISLNMVGQPCVLTVVLFTCLKVLVL